VSEFNPEALVRAFSAFMSATGVKSAGGRMMFGGECFVGILLLLALSMVLAHDTLDLFVSLIRGVDHVSKTGKHFQLFAGCMLFSLAAVFIRELVS
jgi:hypothetical protein